MAKKKILILGMTCNQEFFLSEEALVRQRCYAYDVLNGHYPGVEFWTYTASSDGKYHVNKKSHKISVPADDTLYGTFEKTQKAFRFFIEQEFDFDYIFRTNLSTHISSLTLSKFVDGIPDSEAGTIFSSKIYYGKNVSGPEVFSCYAVGNSMLIPRERVKEIAYADMEALRKVNKAVPDDTDNIYKIDDNAIGLVCNNAAIERGESPFNIWKQFGAPVDFDFNDIMTAKVVAYISIPFRDYMSENREYEFVLGPALRNGTLENERCLLDVDAYEFYRHRVNNNICIVDFNNSLSMFAYREDAIYFSEHGEDFSYDLKKFHGFLQTKYKK